MNARFRATELAYVRGRARRGADERRARRRGRLRRAPPRRDPERAERPARGHARGEPARGVRRPGGARPARRDRRRRDDRRGGRPRPRPGRRDHDVHVRDDRPAEGLPADARGDRPHEPGDGHPVRPHRRRRVVGPAADVPPQLDPPAHLRPARRLAVRDDGRLRAGYGARSRSSASASRSSGARSPRSRRSSATSTSARRTRRRSGS